MSIAVWFGRCGSHSKSNATSGVARVSTRRLAARLGINDDDDRTEGQWLRRFESREARGSALLS